MQAFAIGTDGAVAWESKRQKKEVLGPRCSVLGARCSVLGAGSSVLGAGSSVLGAGSSVPGQVIIACSWEV